MKKFWIGIGVVMVLGAIPALYPSLWRGDGDWSLARDELNAQTVATLETRLGHAAESELLGRFADCITDRTIDWLRQSGCPYYTDDLKQQAQCVHDAGLKAASESIQVECAKAHSPKSWAPYRTLFLGDALRVLEGTSLEPSLRSQIANCVADRLVDSMDVSTCPPVALFEGNGGCFNATRRSRELGIALESCSKPKG